MATEVRKEEGGGVLSADKRVDKRNRFTPGYTPLHWLLLKTWRRRRRRWRMCSERRGKAGSAVLSQ